MTELAAWCALYCGGSTHIRDELRSSARALRMSKSVRAGIIWVNTYRAVSPIAEFGGMKNSGYGRESGFQAVYDYTRPKTVWMNMSSEPLGSQFVSR